MQDRIMMTRLWMITEQRERLKRKMLPKKRPAESIRLIAIILKDDI